jgi:hypothetical protein
MRKALGLLFAATLGMNVMLACVGDDPKPADGTSDGGTSTGGRLQPCNPGGSCNSGFLCVNSVCQDPPETGAPGPDGGGDAGKDAEPFVCPSAAPNNSDPQIQCPEVPAPPTTCGGDEGCCMVGKRCEKPKADTCTTGESMWQCDNAGGCNGASGRPFCCVTGATKVTGTCSLEVNAALASCAADCAGKIELCATDRPCSLADAGIGPVTCKAVVVHRGDQRIKLGVCVPEDGGLGL